MRSIVLTGFMGVGKSTIGRKVAEQLNLPFVDLDRQIEAVSGKTIPDLFAESEQRFRWWEQQTLASLTWETPFVLATGGGALIGAWNRHLVADATVIVLDAALEILQSRLAAEGGRPLAANSAVLYERRHAIYERIPLHIETDGRGVDDIVAQVIQATQYAGRGTQDVETTTHPLAPSQEGETENDSAFRLPLSVEVGRGIAATIGERVADLNPTGVAIIMDETIGRLWGEQVRHDVLAANLPTTVIEVPAGEAHKTIDTISTLYDHLLEAGIDRGGVVVALGGGVIGDMAGFAAATWMRGVKGFVQLPTTLLAMVDASIGGKTGVDHPKGKNLIGAFRQPDFILADPDFLTTLPVREWRSGLAEVIKHGIIADPALFSMLKATPPRDPPQQNDTEAIAIIKEWLVRAIRVKTHIVQRDPYEQGERAKLNLGHTFGHSYETLSGFALAHGEAVAIGMVTAARLSEHLGIAKAGVAEEIISVLAGVGLPTAWDHAPDPDTIWQAMQSDKKKAGKGLRLVLPRAIGDVIVTEPGEIAKEDVIRVLSIE
jgi:shikimate kinase/3-dehydroquinate synthase